MKIRASRHRVKHSDVILTGISPPADIPRELHPLRPPYKGGVRFGSRQGRRTRGGDDCSPLSNGRVIRAAERGCELVTCRALPQKLLRCMFECSKAMQ